MSDKILYFDNNATTRVAPEVLEAMLPYLGEYYGNASSMYRFAGFAQEALAKARGQVAELLGAKPEEIIFTSCGTESDSTAINSALNARPEKKHFITTIRRIINFFMFVLGKIPWVYCVDFDNIVFDCAF